MSASGAPPEQQETQLATIDSHERGAQLRFSVAVRVGRLIEPALEPLGFDWRIGIGILGAFAAREVFVGTLGVVFDISEADETNEPLREVVRGATWPDGARLMTPLAGVSLMVFFVLACQCMSTVAIVRRESGGWRWRCDPIGRVFQRFNDGPAHSAARLYETTVPLDRGDAGPRRT